MSNNGKGKVPEWVQITVQKSKLGFNRVHDELKRLYDERVHKNTAAESVRKPNFVAVVSRRSSVVNKLSRIFGNVKGSLSRYKPSLGFNHYEDADVFSQSSDSKSYFVDKKYSNIRRQLSTERNQSSMPHAELLKSNVYNNDRVIHESVDDVTNELENESNELYAEIDDDKNSIDDSESLFRMELDYESTKQNHQVAGCCAFNKNNIVGKDEQHIFTSGEEEHKYCALQKNRLCANTVNSEKGDVDSHTKPFTGPPSDKKKRSNRSCSSSMKRWSKSRKARYTQLSRSLPTQLHDTSKNMASSCSMTKTSNPSRNSDSKDAEPLSQGNNKKERYGSSERMSTHQDDRLLSCGTRTGKQEKQRFQQPDTDVLFFDYTVEEVADCFKKCAFIGLAQVCLDEQLDGEYFRDISEDDLVEEPFNMNWFHISKLFKVINGWRPRKNPHPDKIKV